MSTVIDLIVLGTVTLSSAPGVADEYQQAADATRRAVLELPATKRAIKKVENTAINTLEYVGLEKDDLVYVSWAVPLVYGKISTKPLKNLKMSGDDWVLRPEVEYEFSSQKVDSMLVFNYRF